MLKLLTTFFLTLSLLFNSVAMASPTLYFVHNDHLGTPQVITDENQNVVWQADYTPFGEAIIQTELITNNIRFPGQYYDQETGLHYNYFRDYDPKTGRYIQSDPIGLQGGLNTYGYVGGNPLNFYDPYGLWAWGDSLPSYVVNFSAGFGDEISYGLTGWLRDQLSIDGGVNSCSASYGAGGIAASIVDGPKGASLDVLAAISKNITKKVPEIKWGAQEKHFPGHNSYTPGRSTMTSDPIKLAQKAGTGQQVGKIPVGQPGSKERVDFGEKIGTYIDQAGNASPTTNGIIHYSKDGIHIVPARP